MVGTHRVVRVLQRFRHRAVGVHFHRVTGFDEAGGDTDGRGEFGEPEVLGGFHDLRRIVLPQSRQRPRRGRVFSSLFFGSVESGPLAPNRRRTGSCPRCAYRSCR